MDEKIMVEGIAEGVREAVLVIFNRVFPYPGDLKGILQRGIAEGTEKYLKSVNSDHE